MRTKKRDKKQGIFFRFFTNPKFLAVLGVIALAMLIFPLKEKLNQRQGIEREIESLEAEISKLDSQNQELESLIKYLQSDQFVEDQARMNLGLKKEGEEVVVIRDGGGQVAGAFSGNDDADTVAKEDKQGSFSNWGKWWSYFFGNNNS